MSAKLASVAQMDARQAGDQDVAGSNPAGVVIIFFVEMIMKYFLILSLPLNQEEL